MKADLIFGLENAGWPAFLVDEHCIIRRASRAAVVALGAVMEGESSNLNSIWSSENEMTAAQFLTHIEHAPAPFHQLAFRAVGGANITFPVNVCAFVRDGRKFFVFQLMPPAPVLAVQHPPDVKVQLAEASAQKHKLDCALQLTRTVALDFNNALTSILGHSSHILSKLDRQNPWRTAVVEIEKSAEKAAEIAADLAAFSRQEKDPRTQQAGNLNELLRGTIELFQKPGATPIKWTLSLESRLYTVIFDEAKMQQAFVKIIENAVQAIPSERAGTVFVHSRNLELTGPTQDRNVHLAAGYYVCVDIVDDGCGMTPEVQNRIFEPFYTTKKGHRGLGLAWVYGIITNHGGSVAVSSETGQGTTFRVYLPASKKIVRESVPREGDMSGTQTILMVDDEDLLLTMGQMVLSAFGYQVLTANSGAKALEIFAQGAPIDVIISDLVMPQMSGRELIERVRRISPKTRIIYSSGYVRPNSGEEHNYLQKPFTSQELLLKVKQVLTNF